MKHMLRLGVMAVFASTAAFADTVQPADVTFVDGAVETPLTAVAGNPDEGAKIMNKGAGNCIACHQVSDLLHLGFHGEIGPPLDGVADRWTVPELRGIVANAKIMFADSMMPSFYKTSGFVRLGDAYTGNAHPGGDVQPLLTAQQIEDVVAYLVTLTEE